GIDKSISPVAAGGMSYKVDVPSGKVWTLRIEADGYRTVTMPLVIGPGEETTLPVVMVPEQPQAAVKKPVTHAKRPAATPVEKPAEAPAPAKPTGNENIVNPF